MKISRRTFVATGFTTMAAAYVGASSSPCLGQTETAAEPAGEDGAKLWLRYLRMEADALPRYVRAARGVLVEGTSPTSRVIREEMELALNGMLGDADRGVGPGLDNGAVLVGTTKNSATIRDMNLAADLAQLGPEGFIIRTMTWNGKNITVIASEGEIGALYGAFHWLRLIQTRSAVENLAIAEKPKVMLRTVNHWDNPNGSIERGYGGRSNWNWNDLPDKLSPRYTMYARASASVGINVAVLNNVNADTRMLTPQYLKKIAALADVWRPYGIRVYLSVNFASPMRLGKLSTADPLDAGVAAWWKAKADEIYKLIPDFGGFLVKANSEGQPGPKDYKRTHAQGANVMADALAPHKGNVIWRAFVYDDNVDPDRAKRAYIEFMALEGQFKPNVLVQIKNGPIDFQPREPFHPLFGALVKTPAMIELQPSQEYLGQAKHLVYLGTMWKEVLDADTFAKGKGSTVGKVLEGKVHPYSITGMAGVVNPGSDANWCGHDFSQSNWYAYGRLAWDHELTAEEIAEEWVRQTWTNDAAAVKTITDMMMGSYETFVNYTMPLGLHHLIGGDHYAPMPQNDRAPRRDWTAVYYHQAAADGIGFDRTMKGDKAVEQYFPPVRDMFDDVTTCPEIYLLWFHRLPWDYKMKSGETLWEELCGKYYHGARQAAELGKTWEGLSGKVDPKRHKAVATKLAIQATHAAQWRDQILGYFQRFKEKVSGTIIDN
jgi:alpha-glucuronidase